MVIYRQTESEVSTISPRTGRPKTDNPKDERITIRLDAETARKLNENTKFYAETKAESIRRGIEVVNKGIKK